jgi:hypothetical protein
MDRSGLLLELSIAAIRFGSERMLVASLLLGFLVGFCVRFLRIKKPVLWGVLAAVASYALFFYLIFPFVGQTPVL